MSKTPNTRATGQSIVRGEQVESIREPAITAGAGDRSMNIEVANVPCAVDVAKCLIQLAATENEPEFLTHMRLQKLLYYTQGWSLALRNRPMFAERIEAWVHGPVVKHVYPVFAGYGDVPIPSSDFSAAVTLSKSDWEFVASVWDAYKVYSATSLRSMTHNESPWLDARKGCAPADQCSKEITQDAMKRFFDEASRRGNPSKK